MIGKLFNKLAGASRRKQLLKQIQNHYGGKIWEMSTDEFVRGVKAGTQHGADFAPHGPNFVENVFADASAAMQKAGSTSPGLQHFSSKSVSGKHTITNITFNDPTGNPLVASQIWNTPKGQGILTNIAKRPGTPRIAVDAVMDARINAGAYVATSFTPGSASAFHRAVVRLATNNQIKKEMIKATMKTRVTESGFTTGLIGKRPGGPRGSRQMPSGGNG